MAESESGRAIRRDQANMDGDYGAKSRRLQTGRHEVELKRLRLETAGRRSPMARA